MSLPVIPSFGSVDVVDYRHNVIAASRQSPVAIGSEMGEVFVLHHADVRSGLTDRALTGVGLSFFDASGVPEGELRDWYGRIMFTNEGQTHHRLRRLVGKAFTPKAITWLREEAAVLSRQRIADLRAKGGGDMLEQIRDVPMHLMCSLLGVPKQDVGKFFAWITDLSPVFTFMTPEQIALASQALHNLRAYVDQMIEERSHAPADDLITRLVEAEEDGDKLTRQETVDMVTNLLVAGQDTTLGQLGCSLYILFKHAKWEEISQLEPLAHAAMVDETIRMEGSIQAAPRTAVSEIELGGESFDAGSIVLLSTYTANRDPSVWVEPDTFKPGRFLDPNVPKMMTFGGGAHFCLGAWLARMTLEEVLRAVISARPRLTCEPEELEWVAATGVNPVSLPVEFDS